MALLSLPCRGSSSPALRLAAPLTPQHTQRSEAAAGRSGTRSRRRRQRPAGRSRPDTKGGHGQRAEGAGPRPAEFQEQSHFVLTCSSLPALTEGCFPAPVSLQPRCNLSWQVVLHCRDGAGFRQGKEDSHAGTEDSRS